MRVRRLWLTDFRNFAHAEVALGPGLTAIVGDNGQGKTNLLEAIGYLARLDSFRGAPTDALVRMGATTAIVRAEIERDGRELLIEAEVGAGRGRVQVNRQRLARTRDLLGALRVTVFAPDDLELVKGGPGERRRYLDDLLVAHSPKLDGLRTDLDRILRQRNALLKQMASRHIASRRGGGRRARHPRRLGRTTRDHRCCARRGTSGPPHPSDSRAAGGIRERFVCARRGGDRVRAVVGGNVGRCAAGGARCRRQARGHDGRAPSRRARLDDRRARGSDARVAGRAAFARARDAARGAPVVSEEIGAPPVLLLDDVFSELDPTRSAALLAHVPPGQVLLTTAGGLPADAHPEQVVHVREGVLS